MEKIEEDSCDCAETIAFLEEALIRAEKARTYWMNEALRLGWMEEEHDDDD